MKQLEALIFDVDGTLADTERDGHRIAFNRAFAEAGLDWDWSVELYGKLLSVTGGKERILHYLDRYRPGFPRPSNLPAFVADLHAAKTKHYVRLLEEGGIPLRPGVKRLLGEAKDAGLRLAIATTTTPANVTALLETALPGGASWFDVIGAGDIVPAKKPAPDIYRYVLQELRLGPDRCLAFEDSAHGLHSALESRRKDARHGQRLHGQPGFYRRSTRSRPARRSGSALPRAGGRGRRRGLRGRRLARQAFCVRLASLIQRAS